MVDEAGCTVSDTAAASAAAGSDQRCVTTYAAAQRTDQVRVTASPLSVAEECVALAGPQSSRPAGVSSCSSHSSAKPPRARGEPPPAAAEAASSATRGVSAKVKDTRWFLSTTSAGAAAASTSASSAMAWWR